MKETEAQTPKRIPAESADSLIEFAQDIVSLLEGAFAISRSPAFGENPITDSLRTSVLESKEVQSRVPILSIVSTGSQLRAFSSTGGDWERWLADLIESHLSSSGHGHRRSRDHRGCITPVSYGSTMGARGVQQLRETAIEIQIAPVRSSVHIPVATLWAHFQGGDVDKGLAELEKAANVMIDDLLWLTEALKAARAGS